MTDKWWRSILKTLTWRIVATLTLLMISLLATGSFVISGAIVSVDFVIKTILYYVHERVWSKVDYGTE